MTDLTRWQDEANLDTKWERRARLAASHIPPLSTVLDLGCGRMALEGFLPSGCVYIPADLVKRDARTVVCELNRHKYPETGPVTHITALGLLEYIHDLGQLFEWIATKKARVVCSYESLRDVCPIPDRVNFGWVNHLVTQDVIALACGAGLDFVYQQPVSKSQMLLLFDAPD